MKRFRIYSHSIYESIYGGYLLNVPESLAGTDFNIVLIDVNNGVNHSSSALFNILTPSP